MQQIKKERSWQCLKSHFWAELTHIFMNI